LIGAKADGLAVDFLDDGDLAQFDDERGVAVVALLEDGLAVLVRTAVQDGGLAHRVRSLRFL